MPAHFSTSQCGNCKHFLFLTQAEIAALPSKITGPILQEKKIYGACMKPVQEPRLIIRQYLNGNETGCEIFEKGCYEENLHIRCDMCQQGEMVIRRPRIHKSHVMVIACNRYPNCNHVVNHIQLKNRCKNCNTPLQLIRGDILKIVCPKCLFPLEIPVSLKIWPALVKPEGGCVHFPDEFHCELCDTSRRVKKSLIELEVDNYLHFTAGAKYLPKIHQKSGLNEMYLSPNFDVVDFMTNGKVTKYSLEEGEDQAEENCQKRKNEYYASSAEEYYDLQKEFEDESDL